MEDNKADLFLIREAIGTVGLDAQIEVVHDGDDAVRFFERIDAAVSAPVPSLIIIDINLPKRHGGEVLQRMRGTRRCANALVLVVTSSDSDRDRERMKELGANGYFRKPSDFDDFMKLGDIVKALLSQAGECGQI